MLVLLTINSESHLKYFYERQMYNHDYYRLGAGEIGQRVAGLGQLTQYVYIDMSD